MTVTEELVAALRAVLTGGSAGHYERVRQQARAALARATAPEQWSTDPPTEPGYYRWRGRNPGNARTVVRVYRHAGELFAETGPYFGSVRFFGGEWGAKVCDE